MAVDRYGNFIWSERDIRDGINQNISSSRRRWRLLRNCNLTAFRGALSKDLGSRLLSGTTLDNGERDTFAGFDAQFSNGTQRLYIFQNSASDQDVYLFNSDRTFTDQGRSLAQTRPSVFMFADRMCVLDGTTLNTVNASGTWTTPGTGIVNDCRFGTVYANRAIVAGSGAQPYTFHPSEVRDVTTWDTGYEVNVTTSGGEGIELLGVCGPFLIVAGFNYTRAYSLSTGHPKDWEWWGLSSLLGAANFASFVEVPHARGNAAVNLAFFWSTEGPVMLAQLGQNVPTIHPLWEPLSQAMQGIEYEGMPALDTSRANQVVSAWNPHMNEVVFAVTKKTTGAAANPRNDMLLCLDLDSALRVAQDPDSIPAFRFRDNTSNQLPCSTIFPVQINPTTGLPSTSGQRRLFCASNGRIHELFAQGVYKDNGVSISFEARRTGYNGEEDGVRPFLKSPRFLKARCTQVGDGTLYANLLQNGGLQSSVSEITLDEGLSVWSSDSGDGTWGDGGAWNAAETIPVRGEFGITGEDFDLRLYDNGGINGPFTMFSWDLLGTVEDRIA